MIPRTLALLPWIPLVASLAACGQSSGGPGPTVRADRDKPAAKAADEGPSAPATERHELHARAVSELVRDRELAAAYREDKLGGRLADEALLLVDPGPRDDVKQTRFFLIPGELSPAPTSVDALKAVAGGDRKPRETLLGGADAGRPMVFSDVAPGTYTACAVVRLAAQSSTAWSELPLRCGAATVTEDAASRVIVLPAGT